MCENFHIMDTDVPAGVGAPPLNTAACVHTHTHTHTHTCARTHTHTHTHTFLPSFCLATEFGHATPKWGSKAKEF